MRLLDITRFVFFLLFLCALHRVVEALWFVWLSVSAMDMFTRMWCRLIGHLYETVHISLCPIIRYRLYFIVACYYSGSGLFINASFNSRASSTWYRYYRAPLYPKFGELSCDPVMDCSLARLLSHRRFILAETFAAVAWVCFSIGSFWIYRLILT